ncbi:MAG TPA: hybrid sensor histidine kinase/response regulator [Myxococcaceae bacterium]|nr:hybrid sensor histidine kinase/response regulator [Myxococcaceae bacterium]
MTARDGPGPASLLLVDDRRENLVALEAILRGPGYRLLTAASGADALKIALREPLAVVLLDVVMPGMDGYEVARHLKELERTRAIPIIFLTALATDVQQIYRAYEVGAVDYLVKPLDSEVVRKKVAVFVDLVRQREQIARQSEALREAERREYELKLAEIRIAGDRRYRKLVEGIDHAIGWTTDEALRFTFVSRQAPRILGFPMEQFLQPGFWETLLHPQDRGAVLAMFRRGVGEGLELVSNHRMLAANGELRWFRTGVSGERAAENQPAELHGISVDVTDLKHAEEEAQRATHVREELLAIVAHDLRSPLTSIRTSAGLLERVAERAGDARVEKTIRIIARSAERMDRLISDLLDFELIQAERLTIERQPVGAAGLIRETVEMFRPTAAEKEIQVEGYGGEDLVVHGNRERLLQILSNLVGNAVKFTPGRGSVTVRAERSGSDALFEVSDTGPGIQEEEQPHIWERYWQASPGRAGKGIGLGLSIAKGLVEAHGGRIWVERRSEGGARFHFTVPLAPAASLEAGEGAHPETVH